MVLRLVVRLRRAHESEGTALQLGYEETACDNCGDLAPVALFVDFCQKSSAHRPSGAQHVYRLHDTVEAFVVNQAQGFAANYRLGEGVAVGSNHAPEHVIVDGLLFQVAKLMIEDSEGFSITVDDVDSAAHHAEKFNTRISMAALVNLR